MTREEAIKWFVTNPFYHKDHAPFNMAIKALEQTDVLDKIRAEIDRQQKWLLQAECTAYNVDIALDAIKAVVAESEEK